VACGNLSRTARTHGARGEQGGRSGGGPDAGESFAIDSESSPGEFNGGRDVGVEALVNWAGMGGAFEFQPILWGD